MVVLFDLPPELVSKILAYLDSRSIVQSRQVCKFFDRIITDDPLFRYKIQLAICGMEDGPPSPLGSADRLARLKSHQRAWDSARWSSEFHIPMRDGNVWELYGGVLAQGIDHSTLTFTQLPSEIREIPQKSWVIKDLPFPMRDFAMDPSQNLLIALEIPNSSHSPYRVHLRSLDSGAVHPAAPDPAYLSHEPEGADYSFAFQISGDFIGAFFNCLGDNKNELLVWNWKTAVLELAISGVALSSFAFLTERHILVAVLGAVNTQIEPKLLVIDFIVAPGEMQDLLNIVFECALYFPSMCPWVAPLVLSIRSDPAPGWAPHPSLQVPFYVAHQDRLFVLTLWVAEEANWKAFVIFLPTSTVLRSLRATLENEKREFPWEEWGPRGTRFIEAPFAHSSVWVCFVYGMSFISAIKARTPGGRPGIQILDFRPLALQKQQSDREGEDMQVDEITQVHGSPNRIDLRGDVFREPVITTLPFRVRTLDPPLTAKGRFTAVMMSEDSVVMVCSRPHVRDYHVLTF